MTIIRLCFLLLVATLAACGGDDSSPQLKKSPERMHGNVPQEVFSGLRGDYAIKAIANGYEVSELAGAGPARIVAANSILRFANVSVALSGEGTVGRIYRLYQAAFNRKPDLEGLSFWVGAADAGLSLDDIARQFVRSSEFKEKYGNSPPARNLVDSFYMNVLGRYGEPAGTEFWVAQLAGQVDPPVAAVLLGFSDSAENKARVAAGISDGIAFIESGVTYPQPQTGPRSSITVTGDAGAYHFAGKTLEMSQADARFRATTYPRAVRLDIDGQIGISLDLESDTSDPLRRQKYAAGAGMSAGSLSCVASGAWTLNRVDVLNGEVVLIDADFAIPCGNYSAQVRGHVVWNKFDHSTPTGPGPAPANHWSPAAGATPAKGNYLYMEAAANNYLLRQPSVLLTPENAGLTVSNQNELLGIGASAGPVDWRLDFQGMLGLGALRPGYYPGLRRYPFHNPAKGGFTLFRAEGGIGKACDGMDDGVLVDSVEYVRGHLRSIDLRFSMSCGISGKLHWVNEEVSQIDGLWQPAPGKTPANGSYVYFQGEKFEYISAGEPWLFTRTNSVLGVDLVNGQLKVSARGFTNWDGVFQGFNNNQRVQPGYYEVPRDAYLSWMGDGRGCGLSGWFNIDNVIYEGDKVKALDLRFELRCQPHALAMQGKIHWVADEVFTVPGPEPVPAGLWMPPAGVIPSLDTYAYFEGPVGSFIAAGRRYLLTTATSDFREMDGPGWFALPMLAKDIFKTSSWTVQVHTMDAVKRFQKGYYGKLTRAGNPLFGSLDVGGDGRGCNEGSGWFVVDDVAYSGEQLMMIELRLEYRCDGWQGTDPYPMNGKVRWVRPK